MDHFQGQDWLSFSTEAKGQDKSIVTVPQLPRLWAVSCLQVAHKGSDFQRKQKGWPDATEKPVFALRSSHPSPKPICCPEPECSWVSTAVKPSLMHRRAALIQSISWLHRAYPLSKSSFIFTLPPWNQLDFSPKTSTRMSHLKLFFRRVLKAELQYSPCPVTTCQETPGNSPRKLWGNECKTGWVFSFSPPPAWAWTCWQQGGMKMALSPTNLLDKQDCALHQKSLFNFSQYFLGLLLLTVIKQLSLEYAIQINQLSAILLKLIIEGLHEPVRDWNTGMWVVQLQMFLYCYSSNCFLLSTKKAWNSVVGNRFWTVKVAQLSSARPINVVNV